MMTEVVPSTAQRIDAHLRAWSKRSGRRSPLQGLGAAFAETGKRCGVDPLFLLAIAGAETSFATDPGAGEDICSRHNPFGLGPHTSYASWQAAIAAAGRTIQDYVSNHGLTTIDQIQTRWAPLGAANDPANQNSEWRRNVKAVYAELGGNPALPVGRKKAVTLGGTT